MAESTRARIIVYGKPGCHLCEIAYDLARGLSNTNELLIEKIDITSDPVLWQEYHDKIPVLVINDHITLMAPIRVAEIRQALTRRQHTDGQRDGQEESARGT
jgi:hypothetical protein